MQTTYSLHEIHKAETFSFSPVDYSRFKFGDDRVAENFGVSLAKGFIRNHLSLNPAANQIVVISSPYAFIPTATFAMKNYFVYELNKWLVESNLPVVHETRIHRTITYKEDYGELDAAERIKLIGNDSFHIDRTFLYGKTLIFLDDIKITGGHEKMIKKMIADFTLTNDIYLLYYAELINKSIHPNVENYLNYYCVKSIFDLDGIIKNDRFAVNTRIVKYILSAEQHSFKVFIQNHNSDFTNLLYNMALGNGYHTIDAYRFNLNELKSYIQMVNQTRNIML
jgi:PRTase ComF-like